MEDDWTSEQLDILERLKLGDASTLLKFLINGGELCTDLKQHLLVHLRERDYQVRFEPKIVARGRRPSRSQNLFRDLELLHMKEALVEKYGMLAGDSEHRIAQKMNTNFDYVTKQIRRAKGLIEFLQKNGNEYIAPSHEEIVEKYPQLFNDI
ncbi:MAG: hypothetical protein O2835_04995 [Proteobacteria bacterium]|nr:hypothetical protein [Pseudomonadota bacterium]